MRRACLDPSLGRDTKLSSSQTPSICAHLRFQPFSHLRHRKVLDLCADLRPGRRLSLDEILFQQYALALDPRTLEWVLPRAATRETGRGCQAEGLGMLRGRTSAAGTRLAAGSFGPL